MLIRVVGVIVGLLIVVIGGVTFYVRGVMRENAQEMARMETIAREMRFSAGETQALIACNKQFRATPIIHESRANNQALDAYCSCHALGMARVLRPGRYDSHANFIDALVNNRKPDPIDEADVRPGLTTQQATNAVFVSYRACLTKLPRPSSAPEPRPEPRLKNVNQVCRTLNC